jgi:hypothetical protein
LLDFDKRERMRQTEAITRRLRPGRALRRAAAGLLAAPYVPFRPVSPLGLSRRNASGAVYLARHSRASGVTAIETSPAADQANSAALRKAIANPLPMIGRGSAAEAEERPCDLPELHRAHSERRAPRSQLCT